MVHRRVTGFRRAFRVGGGRGRRERRDRKSTRLNSSHLGNSYAVFCLKKKTAVPPLDILAEGTLAGETATYRLLVRNHGPIALGPMDLSIDLPAGARLNHCWVVADGLG